ncbi:translation initiation factor eIF2B catalytic subunit epsilon [Starmerella bacillaris]|uniref:Translation initiation factor eIF2B subunit epsilon n=1 Tax=Starmerella bacillaris TaxID=1247836 RepID=A0AAV5RNA1_STABA|nr:translation initiation factor eIF2B catalytic subunit epsilon [Starmerella bacillaris]
MARSDKNLQAVVLCDTYLPRFMPLTAHKPRCLLPLANTPLIEYTLEFLVNCGVSEVYLMCCAHASQVSEYIKSSRWVSPFVPFKVQTIELPNTMSVGDAMRDIDSRGIITSDFLLISGDVVCNIDFDRVWAAHVQRKNEDKNCIMSMVLRKASALHRTRSNRTGLFVVDDITKRLVVYQRSILQKDIDVDSSELLKLTNVAFRNDLIDCRIDICSMDVPALFTENFDYEHLRDDFVRGVLTSDLLGKTIYAHIVDDGYAARVESFKTYKGVTKDIVSRYSYPLVVDSNVVQGKSYMYQRGHIYKERDVVLSQSCTIGMSTIIGSKSSVGDSTLVQGSVIGRCCAIGNNAVVENACLWDNVRIEDGAQVRGAILADNVRICKDAVIEPGAVIGFGVTVEAGTTVPQGARIHAKNRRSSSASAKSKSKSESESGSENGDESDGYGYSDSSAVISNSDDDEPSDTEDLAALVDEMYLSDESIVSLDHRKLAATRKPRRKSRTMSTTSNFSAEDAEDDDEEFVKEAITSINRSIVDKHTQDVAILELNTLRMTMNAPHEKVQEAVVIALVSHIGHLITQSDVKSVTTNVFTTWSPLLRRITFDMVGQTNLAAQIENNCAGMLQGERILAFALMTLYDTDVISENAVYAWHKQPEAGSQVRQLVDQWVEWLENAEEESDDE